MKKSLLFAAALFACTAISAQTVVWTCETASSDGKAIDGTANLAGTVTGSETIDVSDIKFGTGILTPTTCQKTYKDEAGTSYNYCADGYALIKWVPSCDGTDVATIKTVAEAEAAGQYIDFYIFENDLAKVLNLSNIKMDAARLGTDAVRMNVKILGNDGAYDSGWLINGDNWSSISEGIGSWTEGETADGDFIPGYQPAREDGSKKLNCHPTDGCSHLTIPAPTDMPTGEDGLYEMTVRVLVYGIPNTKALALHNVTINLGDGTGTGIAGVEVKDEVDANAPVYNIAGQRVSKDAKGLVIVNGKKYLRK